MAGPTIAERRGLTPKEKSLDLEPKRAAVSEINDAIAARFGITAEERDGIFTGRDGFVFDGTHGPDLIRTTYPGISEEGRHFIIRTFYSGKEFNEPDFEVVYPADFQNPGISTQTALNEARKLLTPSQSPDPALTA